MSASRFSVQREELERSRALGEDTGTGSRGSLVWIGLQDVCWS